MYILLARVLGKDGMPMKDNKRKLSPILYILIGLIISALLGMSVSLLLLGKPLPYIRNMFWKYTIIFYFVTGVYTFWLYFLKNYIPIVQNMFKFVLWNFLLSLPYFLSLVFSGAVSINIILIFLPAQIILLAGGFIWYVSYLINPKIEKYSKTISVKFFLFAIVVIFISIYFNLSESIALSLSALIMLGSSLFLLKRSKINMLKPSSELIGNKEKTK